MATEAGGFRGPPSPYLASQNVGDLIVHRAKGHGQVRVAAANAFRASQVEACRAARATGQCGRLHCHWRDP